MLSSSQIQQFFDDGYCVEHTEVDPGSFERAIRTNWSLAPAGFEPSDPATWTGMLTDSCRSETVERRQGRVKWRKKEPWVCDMLGNHPAIQECVEQLIGGQMEPCHMRGLYPVFPTDFQRDRRTVGHQDRHRFQVGVVLYLTDVEPGAGGFTVWPGAHRVMAEQYETLGGDSRRKSHKRTLKAVHRAIDPVEISGAAGCTVFWHYRMTHAAGINRSQEVRHAVLGDFKNRAFEENVAELPPDPWEHWRGRPGTPRARVGGPAVVRRLRRFLALAGGSGE